MTLAEMQNLVNYRRRDITESFISSDEIKDYLNEANRKVLSEREWEWNKTSSSLSFSVGSYTYALSSIGADFREPLDVFYNNSYDFQRVSPNNFRQLSGTGQNMYAIEGLNMLVDTSFGSGSLVMPYYSNYSAKTSAGSWIKEMSSSDDEPTMPERFQDALVDYADARCQRKEGNIDDFNIAMSSYRDALSRMKREYPSDRKLQLRSFGFGSSINKALDNKENPLRQ